MTNPQVNVTSNRGITQPEPEKTKAQIIQELKFSIDFAEMQIEFYTNKIERAKLELFRLCGEMYNDYIKDNPLQDIYEREVTKDGHKDTPKGKGG